MKAQRFYTAHLVILISVYLSCTVAAAAPAEQCRRVVMQGKIDAGHSWSKSFGQGWMFRLLPIKAGNENYSGWDLAVDRTGGAGYPDALLLATPPYDSINQREVGTTFGLRAQDAIGWNPRTFRFLIEPASLRKAQRLFFKLRKDREASENDQGSSRRAGDSGGGKSRAGDSNPADDLTAVSKSLMDLSQRAANGQFRIIDARLTPGTADALPYAQNWALQQRNTPHTITPTNSPTPYGKLDSLKFEITLWLPANWKAPKSVESAPSACQ